MKFKTKVVIKSNSDEEERLILNPPYTVFGSPHIEQSQSIIMRIGGLKQMIEGLDDEDSFRIEWFADKATEFSFLKHKKGDE
jgi:hypothetical protein